MPNIVPLSRKLHPFGNDYHTICCMDFNIMYRVDIVESKDCPKELPPKKHYGKRKPVGLVCRLTTPIHHTGKVVTMDSGFGVLKAVMEMKRFGVHGLMAIKKCRYWPKDNDGDMLTCMMET